MSENKPAYTLETREIAPYWDFFRMYWRMNRISDIVLIILIAAGLGYSIYLATQPIDVLGIGVFITVGVAFLLLLALLFLLPFLNRRASAKNADKIKINFYEDRLVAVPADENDHRQGTLIVYSQFTCFFETKTSYICLMGKAGIVLRKDSGVPEWIVKKMKAGAETAL